MEQQKINTFLEAHPTWQPVDGSLTAMWSFESFAPVKESMSKLCELFDELNHHPTVTFSYNFIRVETTTHDAGNEVTEKDIELAERVSELLNK